MKKQFLLYLILFITIGLLTSACDDDDPLSAEEDHIEAEGMIFEIEGIEIARIFQGVTTDTLFAEVGVLGKTTIVKFLNHDEEIVELHEEDSQTLSWEMSNNSLAAITNDNGAFEFRFKGLLEGETEIQFFIMHDGHPDFRSEMIPLVVR